MSEVDKPVVHMSTGRPEAGRHYAQLYDDAQSQLAALREELDQTKRTAITEILALNSTLRDQAKELAELSEIREYATAPLRERCAERKDLQQRLADAERRNAELKKDKDRLDAIEQNFWDVRHSSHPIADTGDSSSYLEIVGHWMDKPFERVIGENYSEDLRAAIDQAMASPAYPPERPEYPEIDAALNPNPEAASHDE